MDIIPEIVELRDFGGGVAVASVQMSHLASDVYILSCWVELEFDPDGEGRFRTTWTAHDLEGAKAKFDKLTTLEDVFDELCIDYEGYQEEMERWN